MNRLLVSLLGLVMTVPALAGPKFTVRDTEGRPLDIELIAATGETFTFRRQDDRQRFTLPLEKVDAASRELIAAKAASLGPEVPELAAEVVVGKRRKKDGYYMVNQTVTCTVKIKNTSLELPCPELKAKIAFIGQDRRTPSKYSILATREFPVEIEPGGTATEIVKEFTTRYDSDNKGTGNIGGYEYTGYLLTLFDSDGSPVFEYTTDATIRRALTRDVNLAKNLVNHPVKTQLDENMQKRE